MDGPRAQTPAPVTKLPLARGSLEQTLAYRCMGPTVENCARLGGISDLRRILALMTIVLPRAVPALTSEVSGVFEEVISLVKGDLEFDIAGSFSVMAPFDPTKRVRAPAIDVIPEGLPTVFTASGHDEASTFFSQEHGLPCFCGESCCFVSGV